jgi:dTDP-4-dehydrorhamnose reductase
MSSQKISPTILVTGSAGQLGSEIKILSKSFSAFNFLFVSRAELSLENETRVQKFFNENVIDYCINCAAYTAVDKAESEKEKAFLINANAVGNLAKICSEHQTKLIHISTDYVYNGTVSVPLKEDSTVGPINTYGLSKLKGEELTMNQNPSALIIRTSWVYSSFGNNFVKTMLRLFREKEEINVIDDQIGSPTYAADLALVIMKIIEKQQQGHKYSGIFNYSNEGVTSWYGFANEIKRLVKSNCKINPIATASYPTAAKRPLYSVLDTAKIKSVLNIEIPSWQASLKKCIDILSDEKVA